MVGKNRGLGFRTFTTRYGWSFTSGPCWLPPLTARNLTVSRSEFTVVSSAFLEFCAHASLPVFLFVLLTWSFPQPPHRPHCLSELLIQFLEPLPFWVFPCFSLLDRNSWTDCLLPLTTINQWSFDKNEAFLFHKTCWKSQTSLLQDALMRPSIRATGCSGMLHLIQTGLVKIVDAQMLLRAHFEGGSWFWSGNLGGFSGFFFSGASLFRDTASTLSPRSSVSFPLHILSLCLHFSRLTFSAHFVLHLLLFLYLLLIATVLCKIISFLPTGPCMSSATVTAPVWTPWGIFCRRWSAKCASTSKNHPRPSPRDKVLPSSRIYWSNASVETKNTEIFFFLFQYFCTVVPDGR